MTVHVEITEEVFNLSEIDPEVREAVTVLREHGIDTFASCSGHGGNNPWIRCQPCDPKWLFRTLLGLGYDGFYVKEYRSGPVGPQVIFTEIEFWNLDCLNRKCNGSQPKS